MSVVEFELHQLRALAAAISEGSFEGAARALHVTPSAISQRIGALERAAGRVLLVRSKPVRVTPSGQPILLLARQVDLLTADAAAGLRTEAGANDPSLGDEPPRPTLTIAVNADSLSTWFLPVLAPLGRDMSFHVLREDEGRTSELLRDGTAVAAVTTDVKPVAGCTVTALGSMRYLPVAAASFAARWFPNGPTSDALLRAPVLVFDRDDPLQHAYIGARVDPHAPRPPSHMIPSSTDFAAAIRLGLGWGMLDELQLPAPGDPEQLVDLEPGGHIDVPLYWQQWRLRTPSLDRLTEAVVSAARAALRTPTH